MRESAAPYPAATRSNHPQHDGTMGLRRSLFNVSPAPRQILDGRQEAVSIQTAAEPAMGSRGAGAMRRKRRYPRQNTVEWQTAETAGAPWIWIAGIRIGRKFRPPKDFCRGGYPPIAPGPPVTVWVRATRRLPTAEICSRPRPRGALGEPSGSRLSGLYDPCGAAAEPRFAPEIRSGQKGESGCPGRRGAENLPK